MRTEQNGSPAPRRPLRLWPGIAAALMVGTARFLVPEVFPEAGGLSVLAGLAGVLVILLWWLLFSRASWTERLIAVAFMALAAIVTKPVLHQSIAGAGRGFLFFIVALETMSLALVAWAVLSRRWVGRVRLVSMAAMILAAGGAWALVRTGGISGEGDLDLHWRWSPTPEERLLQRAGALPPASPASEAPAGRETSGSPSGIRPGGARDGGAPSVSAAPEAQPEVESGSKPAGDGTPASSGNDLEARSAAAAGSAEAIGGPSVHEGGRWPGFRGPNRDGVITGLRISTDWTASPPAELWRRPIGPGWSSFAVDGDRIYTQEQRGDHEVVSSYRLATGEPVWGHRDPVRFYESNGGAGPRATPTVHEGRVYALGATGLLNALDAATGAVIWSRDAAADTGQEIPEWGLAGSPLVVGDVLLIAVSGQLVAYDRHTGHPRWFGPPEGGGYSSPHFATLQGVPQVLLLRGRRTTSFAPADGAVLWEHSWQPGASIVQPAITPDGDVLVNTADAMGGQGLRRLAVARGAAGWTVEERWTTRGLKPYFNDYVAHRGHAYGFDGSILACVDLETGDRRWKGGRYGHGQLLLLADQDLLLVLSEHGELALVGATPDGHRELARVKAVEGKTWNHPVLVGDVLLVRNGEEMAAFRLAPAGR